MCVCVSLIVDPCLAQFTSYQNPDIFGSINVKVGAHHAQFAAPTDVRVGDAFLVSYTLYANNASVPVDGTLFPDVVAYIRMSPTLHSPLLLPTGSNFASYGPLSAT